VGFKGTANWLSVQAREEMAHAVHMYQQVLDRGAAPLLLAIGAPGGTFSGLTDVFEKILAHERGVTARINHIATLAMQEGDHAGYQFILWYVGEQLEEEANDTDILNKLEWIGDNRGLLLNLDKDLATRVYANPFPTDVKLSGGAPAMA